MTMQIAIPYLSKSSNIEVFLLEFFKEQRKIGAKILKAQNLYNLIREKIEVILQETLFEPRALLEQTVAEAMTQTLEIRDAVLQRTKDIRTGKGDITICPEQGVNQEQFLTMVRMDIMTVLLSLIEPDAPTPDKLQVRLKKNPFYSIFNEQRKIGAKILRIFFLNFPLHFFLANWS